jgi:hypothetical protein
MQYSFKSIGVVVVLGLVMAILAVSATPAGAAEPCGSELIGAGSSMQATAQAEVWGSQWKGGECEKKPTVRYTATSSGQDLEQWGANKGALGGLAGLEKPFPMFIGTDVAPEGPETTEGTQMGNMVKAGGVLKSRFANGMVTVPVAQTAVAVVVSLPKGCKAEGTSAEVKSKALEEAWEKGTVAFKALIVGVKLEGKACEEVKKEGASLQPLLEARETTSGASAALKRYLAQVGPEKNEFKSLTTTAEKSAGSEWPKTLPTGLPQKAGNTTDKALAQKVIKTAGSIGYAGLADAVSAGFGSKPAEVAKGSGYQSFYVLVQNNAKEAKEVEYASPESAGASNCAGAEYKEVPTENNPDTDWSHVIDDNVEGGKKATYPICTLTFDLSWLYPGMPEMEGKYAYGEEAESAIYSYLRYIVATEAEGGGQSKGLEEKHYAKLPASIQKVVAEGLSVGARPPGPRAVPWPTVVQEGNEARPNGRPWVATVGDSYISGEAGRWAGNSNYGSWRTDALGDTAYLDNAQHNAEQVPLCHRSASAEAYININSAAGEVAGVNFACSGAKTVSEVADGHFIPGLDNGIGANEGQAKLLEEFARTHNVKLVVISIGGNDFNFAKVVAQCVTDYILSIAPFRTLCSQEQAVRDNFNAASLAARKNEIQAGIERIATAMTTAGTPLNSFRIVVQNYESAIPPGASFRYSEEGGRQVLGGCGFWDADANWANNTALPLINATVREAAQAAKRNNVSNLQLLELGHAFLGRRLCEVGVEKLGSSLFGYVPRWEELNAVDKAEWINEIRTALTRPLLRAVFFRFYYIQEVFHPNYWAQLGLRNCLRQVYNFLTGPNARDLNMACLRGANGLTNRGEPNQTLAGALSFASSGPGTGKGKGQTFVVGETTFKCGESPMQWKQTGVSESLVFTPTYEKCVAVHSGTEVSAKVTTKGCTLTLTEPIGEEEHQGWMALPSGCAIELAASLKTECRVKIEGPQEFASVNFRNLSVATGAYEGKVDPEVVGMFFTSEGEGCASAGIESEGAAEYQGTLVEKGVIVEEPGMGEWRERSVGESGHGYSVYEGSPEKIQSKGGESKLVSKVAGEVVPVTCGASKGAGILYNGILGGQGKLSLALEKCSTKVVHCVVAEPISIPVNLHLTWKWNGVKADLSQGKQQTFGQKPTVLFTHNGLEGGAPKGEDELTTIKLSKDGVGVCILSGLLALKGYEAAELEPPSTEQFSAEPKLKFSPGKHLEHYWNGTEEHGVESTLKLGSEAAEFTSSMTLAPLQTPESNEQEVGVFEG